MSAFIDTNVIVYTFDRTEAEKRETARRLLAAHDGDLVVSTQVLQETYNGLTRRLAIPLSALDAAAAVTDLCEYAVVPSDGTLVLDAIHTSITAQLSIWDALIVEAAVRGGCQVLYSEDLNAGQIIKGVQIVNPFA